jgi:hypothetical protein
MGSALARANLFVPDSLHIKKSALPGERKIFRDSAVENLTEFFQRFRQLNIRSNAELDELVEQAKAIVQDVKPQELRDNQGLRQHVAVATVQMHLDAMLIDRPRRNIIRSIPVTSGAQAAPR